MTGFSTRTGCVLSEVGYRTLANRALFPAIIEVTKKCEEEILLQNRCGFFSTSGQHYLRLLMVHEYSQRMSMFRRWALSHKVLRADNTYVSSTTTS